MLDTLKVMFWLIGCLFRSEVSLEAENAVLRHQINVLRRQFQKRPAFTNSIVSSSLFCDKGDCWDNAVVDTLFGSLEVALSRLRALAVCAATP